MFIGVSTNLIVCVLLLKLVNCQDGCTTPDNKIGRCIQIKNCKQIIDILENAPRPFSENLKNALSKYKCSKKGSPVSVCCPESPIIISRYNDNQTNLYLPGVTDHANFKLLPIDCGGISKSDRADSEISTWLEFPWTALISYKSKTGSQFICGGTIINNRYILTAAHCITNLTHTLLEVRIGEQNTITEIDCHTEYIYKKCTSPVQDVGVEEVIVHPNYEPIYFSDDIGLLRVAEMNLTVENAMPICMPVQPTNTSLKYSIISGFGIFDNATVLRKENVAFRSQQDCQSAFVDFKRIKITDKHLCAAGSRNPSECPGNGGDPIQNVEYLNEDVRMVQYGVLSVGNHCSKLELPIVFTKVASYLNWILDSIQP